MAKRRTSKCTEDDTCPPCGQFIKNCDSLYKADSEEDGQSFICPNCGVVVFMECEVDVTFWSEVEIEEDVATIAQ